MWNGVIVGLQGVGSTTVKKIVFLRLFCLLLKSA